MSQCPQCLDSMPATNNSIEQSGLPIYQQTTPLAFTEVQTGADGQHAFQIRPVHCLQNEPLRYSLCWGQYQIPGYTGCQWNAPTSQIFVS